MYSFILIVVCLLGRVPNVMLTDPAVRCVDRGDFVEVHGSRIAVKAFAHEYMDEISPGWRKNALLRRYVKERLAGLEPEEPMTISTVEPVERQALRRVQAKRRWRGEVHRTSQRAALK